MRNWRRRLTRAATYLTSDRGQAMVEYSLILALVVVVVIVLLMVLGNQVRNMFCNISGGVGGA
jgi:pilus assembly protein Flp/PilA